MSCSLRSIKANLNSGGGTIQTENMRWGSQCPRISAYFDPGYDNYNYNEDDLSYDQTVFNIFVHYPSKIYIKADIPCG